MLNTYIVATAIIQYNNKYLIARRAKSKKFAPGKWEFISGFVEEKEPAEITLLREIEEEIHVQGTILQSYEPFTTQDVDGRWVIIPYLIGISTDNITLNSPDHSEALWIQKKDFEKFPELLGIDTLRNYF